MSASLAWEMLGLALRAQDTREAQRWMGVLRDQCAQRKRAAQPLASRSLDLGLRHLGTLVRCPRATRCAVCSEPLAAGALAVECSATNALSHRACGELITPEGAACG